MEVLIKQIKNESSAAVIDIILPIQQIEFNVPITLNDQPDLLDIENVYYHNGGAFWGASVNEELAGTIALLKFDNDLAAIRKMFVKKDFRGKELGLAQRLLETLVQYCKDNEIKHLYLGTVSVLQAAMRFYERNGFEQIEKSALPKSFPLMSADNVFYHLAIK
ncbi:GNAT family N-acetyltransferase [Pedobacter caeni]|uniref:N-acetylglutamate synthase, GNAT family n=1 Tax=Pedobacter caeni TaxID=288992 RepID=A0A1M5B2L4_9SPHI|nr:GNAT family N-acetyltransferase [Pedobacter caeni]SHF36695.1 N-acetylglutamate synthase, GNAT family [Pedobacter caeni]